MKQAKQKFKENITSTDELGKWVVFITNDMPNAWKEAKAIFNGSETLSLKGEKSVIKFYYEFKGKDNDKIIKQGNEIMKRMQQFSKYPIIKFWNNKNEKILSATIPLDWDSYL